MSWFLTADDDPTKALSTVELVSDEGSVVARFTAETLMQVVNELGACAEEFGHRRYRYGDTLRELLGRIGVDGSD